MTLPSFPPRISGETIVILGTPAVPGTTLFQCLLHRGYLPLTAQSLQEVQNLFDHAIVSALVVMQGVPLEPVRDFCILLRKTNAVTPVVVLLNNCDRNHGIDLLESGADHFATLPYRVDDLLHLLRSFTRRTYRLDFKPKP